MTEISLSNSQTVPEATMDSDLGLVKKIREQALATQITAKVESSKVDDAGKAAVGDDAFSMIATAAIQSVIPGAKEIITGGEIIAARFEDKNIGAASPVAPVPIEQSIRESTTREPGLHSVSVAQSVYGGDPKTSKDLSANVAERASMASMSLVRTKDTEGLFQSDKKKPLEGMTCETTKDTLATAKVAQELVFGNRLASENALNSAIRVERAHSASAGMAMGNGMAPTVAMKMTPRNLDALMSDVSSQGDFVTMGMNYANEFAGLKEELGLMAPNPEKAELAANGPVDFSANAVPGAKADVGMKVAANSSMSSVDISAQAHALGPNLKEINVGVPPKSAGSLTEGCSQASQLMGEAAVSLFGALGSKTKEADMTPADPQVAMAPPPRPRAQAFSF